MYLLACSYALLWIKDSLSFVISWIACAAIDLSIFMLMFWIGDYMPLWALDHMLLSLLVMCLGTVSLDVVSLTQYQGIDFLLSLWCSLFSWEEEHVVQQVVSLQLLVLLHMGIQCWLSLLGDEGIWDEDDGWMHKWRRTNSWGDTTCWTTCSSSQLKRLHQRDRRSLCLGTGLVRHYSEKQNQDTQLARIATNDPKLIKVYNQQTKTWAWR